MSDGSASVRFVFAGYVNAHKVVLSCFLVSASLVCPKDYLSMCLYNV